MKNIILVFLTLVFTFSSCIMQEPKKFDDTTHPEPCFLGSSFKECTDYSAPIPSDYMSAVLPAGIPISLSFPSSYPLNIRLSSPVDISTLKDGLHVLKTDGSVHEVVESTKYVIQLGELDTKTFQFSDDKTFLNILPVNDDMTPGVWDEGFTYLVVLSKELKDINGLEYAKPAAFFMAASTFEITPDIVKALDPTMTENEALATVQVLLEMRKSLNAPFQLIEFLLNKTKFDVSFLWSFQFNSKTVCFQSTDIKNCENDIIPMPSDFMSMALPANTHLNNSPGSSFSINFSDDIDLDSFEDNLVIVRTPVLVQGAPELVSNEEFEVTFDSSNSKKVLISNNSGAWDNNFTYIMYLKKGVVTTTNIPVLPSLAFFLGLEENTLLDTDGTPGALLSSLGFTKDDEGDIALAQSLEGLRLFNEPLVALAQSEGIGINKEDLLMIWTVTIEGVIPCFNSADFKGCENANLAPLPSDFIMKDGHLDLPIDENAPDMLKGLMTALNSLDGWSTVKPFNITLSDNIDPETLTAANLLVLKIADETGMLAQPVPVGVIPSFREDWKQLDIKPLLRKWDEKSTYLVVLTNDIKGTNGENFVKPIGFSFMTLEESLLNEDGSAVYSSAMSDETAQALEAGRLQFKPALDALATMTYTRDKISMMWTVTTQSVTDDIKSMRAFVLANPGFTDSMTLSDAQTIPNAAFPSVFPGIELSNVSVIAFGTFKAPMFLSESTSPYMGAFNPNKFPADESTPPTENAELLDIPFLVAFPTPADENVVANNKVIIFQHGFSRQKEDVLPLLNSFTAQGYIVVSYDLPFHGGRTLDGANTGDGFISLNVFASRDNIRQAVLEQVKLIKTLKGIDFSAIDTTNQIKYSTIDADNIYYVGHSMGTFVGNILVSIEDSIKAGVLNAAGANFTKMLMSTTEDIKSPLTDGLAALGIVEGTPEFDQFLYLAQVGVEKADSINYKSATDNILIQEAVNDPVIINEITRDFGISQGFVNPMDNTIIKPSNYISYTTNASIEDIHSFLLLDTDATDDARSDVLNFFLNAQ